MIPHSQTQRDKSSSNVFSLDTEEQIKKLNDEEVDKGWTITFFLAGGGYHFWDLQTIILRVMHFKQFFSLHFVMKKTFMIILKRHYRLFYRSYSKKALPVHAYT